MMRKLKLYLDTSVISNLYDTDEERLVETWLLWEKIKGGQYEIVLSKVVFEEIDDCQQPKRSQLYEFLADIEYANMSINQTIRDIAEEILKLGIIKEKKLNDRLHIGCAIYSDCDIIISWNFTDMVNVRTVRGVRTITTSYGYKNIDIFSPKSFRDQEE